MKGSNEKRNSIATTIDKRGNYLDKGIKWKKNKWSWKAEEKWWKKFREKQSGHVIILALIKTNENHAREFTQEA